VVYDRKKHYFKWKDVNRIAGNLPIPSFNDERYFEESLEMLELAQKLTDSAAFSMARDAQAFATQPQEYLSRLGEFIAKKAESETLFIRAIDSIAELFDAFFR
jgi:hypothetical protein